MYVTYHKQIEMTASLETHKIDNQRTAGYCIFLQALTKASSDPILHLHALLSVEINDGFVDKTVKNQSR